MIVNSYSKRLIVYELRVGSANITKCIIMIEDERRTLFLFKLSLKD